MRNDITPERIRLVCDGVWRDRAAILEMRGATSGEEALVGAAYWRLCKAGRLPGQSLADCAPFLRDLMRRYRAESGRPAPLATEPSGGKIMRIQTAHFERARSVVRQWREDGFDTVMVVRQRVRASHCYPCRQRDVPEGAVASWDYYHIPSARLLKDTAPTERTASRAELWVAATIAYGYVYPAAEAAAP